MSAIQKASTEDANRRFEGHFETLAACGVLLSVAAHFALFTLSPPLRVVAAEHGGRATMAVNLPPAIEVPPAPEPVARPAVPRVAVADVSEDVTITPTTFGANPVEHLPPPPRPTATPRAEEDHPRFIPYDTPPRLLNGEAIAKLLQQDYPASLRQAGIEAKVTLWVYIDEAGSVVHAQVHESCGYAPLDAAALRVCDEMKFRPARNRDKVTPVWVQQTVVFKIV